MPTNTKALQVAEPAGFIAGKNKFINGDFNINQRAFSSTTTSTAFMFDRWKTECSGGTVTYSAQTFTAGAAPVAGYESTNYLQVVTSGQSGTNYADMYQNIEDVRALAGQTVTISWWAKAASGTPKMSAFCYQYFGTGGSAAVFSNPSTTVTLSTSLARYSLTINVASIAVPTILIP